jgi:hypothetical protein
MGYRRARRALSNPTDSIAMPAATWGVRRMNMRSKLSLRTVSLPVPAEDFRGVRFLSHLSM